MKKRQRWVQPKRKSKSPRPAPPALHEELAPAKLAIAATGTFSAVTASVLLAGGVSLASVTKPAPVTIGPAVA